MSDAQLPPEVLVIQPDLVTGLDRFEGWLVESGVRTRVLHPYAGDPLPEKLDAAGLIVLGGRTSLAGDDEHAWLDGARELLRQAVDADIPALGICLGAQMLAQATGGTVAAGEPGTEVGAVQVKLAPAAGDDELFSGLPDPFVSGSFHSDAVTELPPGAVLLGGTAMYPHQAFRVGRHAWGVQFHPELTVERYRTWVEIVVDPTPAVTEHLRHGEQELVRHEAEVVAASSSLARRFATVVLAAARQS
jgi:GMP synthase (glutamine-hydrolysing)